MRYASFLATLGLLVCLHAAQAEEPRCEAELIFPLNEQHNHAPGIVECPNGDLLASWYRGSGERKADDVVILGARKRKGSDAWSEPFLLADHPELPDCNTAMIIDPKERLWLFWPIILDNHWESALTCYKVASHYTDDGPPRWDRDGVMFLKPDDFSKDLIAHVDQLAAEYAPLLTPEVKAEIEGLKKRASDKLYQRLGWMPRCKPTILPSGRILLPLYCDTFSISIMAVSDDGGEHWYASNPLIGMGAIQPTVLRRNDGTLVAYMRENGLTKHIRVCQSKDDGITWGPVGTTDLPNPGAGIDGVRLANGHWLLVYNDTTGDRSSLAISISEDEGRTWKWTRHLEKHESGAYHYPCVTQGSDGTIHLVYSYFVQQKPQGGAPSKEGKSMKHVALSEAWILAGDGK
jgi:predicted neuraminidase